jgi:uncharacterized membrane protein (UPF0127 family)
MTNFLMPLIREAHGAFELRNQRTGTLIARTVIPAFEPAARRKGLLGRDSLPAGSAMVIAPTNAIHTFWMRFAIDVVFVTRMGKVVTVRRNVPPWRAVVALRGYAVIELPAGALAADDVIAGDMLTLAPAVESVHEGPRLARAG